MAQSDQKRAVRPHKLPPSQALLQIAQLALGYPCRAVAESQADAAHVKGAPYTMPVRRLDDVRAAKQLDLTWTPPSG